MQLRELGEFGLIEQIEREARKDAEASSGIHLGIGDDAALLRPKPGEDVALSVDAVVDGVHFRIDAERPARIGARALRGALSDLAAMGARPLGALLSLAAPPSSDAALARGALRGAARAGRSLGCPVVGGNVTRARQFSLHTTVVGAVSRGTALTRSGARVGQRVFVTGRLGEAGLAHARRAADPGRRPAHRIPLPQPRVEAGRRLARLPGVGACIDLSDGLLSDLAHLAKASRVGAEIDLATLPRRRGFDRACERLGKRPLDVLTAFGEDYELLFTASPRAGSEASIAARIGVPVRQIGIITARNLRYRNGRIRRGAGWRHF